MPDDSLRQSAQNIESSSRPPSDSQDVLSRRPKPVHDFPKTQAGKMWDALSNPAGGPVNEMPGGTYNSAGGKPKETSVWDAFTFSELSKSRSHWFFQDGCVRDSLMVGIPVGGAVGGLRFILRGLTSLLTTANWAVGGFAATSVMMHYWCQKRRHREREGIAQAVAGMKMLNEQKARQRVEEKAREEREEQERLQKEKEGKWGWGWFRR